MEAVFAVALFTLGVIAFSVWAVWYGFASRRKLQQRLGALALSQDLTDTPEARDLRNRWRGKPFTPRNGRYLNLLSGRTGRYNEFRSFVYEYVVSTGKSTTVIDIGVWTLRLPAHVPDLMVTGEGFGTKIAKIFGGQDIQVGFEPFDKAFRIQSSNEDFARTLLAPEVVRWLNGIGKTMGLWRIVGDELICWRRVSGNDSSKRMLEQLELMETLLSLIPGAAWEPWGPAQITAGPLDVPDLYTAPLMPLGEIANLEVPVYELLDDPSPEQLGYRYAD
ncbi:MAG: hypothetical protein LBE83_09360 [Propionibacteriaceae bacterium]|jgi:hypothetical protein|nr:hypothetical protein [Propionibacteriaceae bacterium]